MIRLWPEQKWPDEDSSTHTRHDAHRDGELWGHGIRRGRRLHLGRRRLRPSRGRGFRAGNGHFGAVGARHGRNQKHRVGQSLARRAGAPARAHLQPSAGPRRCRTIIDHGPAGTPLPGTGLHRESALRDDLDARGRALRSARSRAGPWVL